MSGLQAQDQSPARETAALPAERRSQARSTAEAEIQPPTTTVTTIAPRDATAAIPASTTPACVHRSIWRSRTSVASAVAMACCTICSMSSRFTHPESRLAASGQFLMATNNRAVTRINGYHSRATSWDS